jgi:hypothetical protein
VCIIGYPQGVKGYRQWKMSDESSNVILSRDVVFKEDTLYKDLIGDKREKWSTVSDSISDVQFEVEEQLDGLTNEVEVGSQSNRSSTSNGYNLARDR